MSRTWLMSDPHIEHQRIGVFRDIPEEYLEAAGGDAVLANTLHIRADVCRFVRPRDKLLILGDSTWSEKGVLEISSWPGDKENYGGNHDDLAAEIYLQAFSNIRGCKKLRKGRGWVSHFPVHEQELRGHFCNHGHVHNATIPDWRYVNLCCDNLYKETGFNLISLEDLDATHAHRREHHDTRIILAPRKAK